ncbi:3-keto-5-aminohexanoate cleavage protein [Prosthecomicrobium sp. N25]|uniref:3-keto-5-aminohexanoate cleavage protein n=1 Tax=Prosthecomicrobium sp. N25 TaxID=3129254 RepID=UPI0030780140
MAEPVWIEAALNGPWGRGLQPGIPVSVSEIVAEGIAAAEAGAAIVHFHAYDEATGRQQDDWEIYARIIEGIRARADVIAYPTIPLAGSGLGAFEPAGARDRFRHIDELGRRGLLEWTVVDPGSVNFARLDAIAAGEPGFVYLNPESHVGEGLRVSAAHGIRPSYAIYEPGFSRLGAALAARSPGLRTPVYRLMFSDRFAWGFPPRDWALEAHLRLLGEVAPGAAWMVAGLGVDIDALIEPAVARGGHVRVGLEDAIFGEARSNRALVDAAVRRVRALGRDPATTAEVRRAAARTDSVP